MEKSRRYLGVPIQTVPPGKFASQKDVLRVIFSFNGGNMRGFKYSKMHCERETSSSGTSTICRDPQNGCIAKGELCIYQRVKANWDTFPCISDLGAIRKMERLKARYDANIMLKELDHKMIDELETTFHFEAPDFEQQIMSDRVLSPAERTAKLNVLLDYVGPEATR
jgi:hypothetical protein